MAEDFGGVAGGEQGVAGRDGVDVFEEGAAGRNDANGQKEQSGFVIEFEGDEAGEEELLGLGGEADAVPGMGIVQGAGAEGVAGGEEDFGSGIPEDERILYIEVIPQVDTVAEVGFENGGRVGAVGRELNVAGGKDRWTGEVGGESELGIGGKEGGVGEAVQGGREKGFPIPIDDGGESGQKVPPGKVSRSRRRAV